MGAWDYGPFDNDYAMEWVENDINIPILSSIRKKLDSFIQYGFNDDIEKHQATASVALLIQLCQPQTTVSASCCPIHLHHQAKEDNTFHLATTVMNLLLDDHSWIERWSDPEKVRQMLAHLVRMLRQLQDHPKP